MPRVPDSDPDLRLCFCATLILNHSASSTSSPPRGRCPPRSLQRLGGAGGRERRARVQQICRRAGGRVGRSIVRIRGSVVVHRLAKPGSVTDSDAGPGVSVLAPSPPLVGPRRPQASCVHRARPPSSQSQSLAAPARSLSLFAFPPHTGASIAWGPLTRGLPTPATAWQSLPLHYA